ncbi:MAG: hypothetical protein ACREBG_25580 [Pyrinomonadaceae bacterium]
MKNLNALMRPRLEHLGLISESIANPAPRARENVLFHYLGIIFPRILVPMRAAITLHSPYYQP